MGRLSESTPAVQQPLGLPFDQRPGGNGGIAEGFHRLGGVVEVSVVRFLPLEERLLSEKLAQPQGCLFDRKGLGAG